MNSGVSEEYRQDIQEYNGLRIRKTEHVLVMTAALEIGIHRFFDSPDPHLHIHVRPRYDKPVILNGNTYIDSEFGHHYVLRKSGVISAEDKKEVLIRLKEWMNR